MLKIYFGTLSNEIYRPGDYFDINYEDSWLSTAFAKRCIKEIDKSELIKDRYIESPYLGAISPLELSGGVKTLILLESGIQDLDDVVFNASACGNNCSELMLEVAKDKDVLVTMHHALRFPEPFEVYIVNSDKIITSNTQLIFEAYNHLHN